MDRKLPLPRGWKRCVRSSILHILALSHYSFTVLLAKANVEYTHERSNHVVVALAQDDLQMHARMPFATRVSVEL